MVEESKARILLVEDDRKLSELVKEFLESRGDFEVSAEYRGDDAPGRILGEAPDLVILDIMLPGMDGIEICKTIRRDGFRGPVLMLTALGDEIDEIVGLEVGADDYMAKPVSPRLLLTRVRAILRRDRSSGPQEDRAAGGRDRLRLGDLAINRVTRTVHLGDAEVSLTTSEYDLLLYLGERAGEVVSREEIYQALRGIDWDGLDRSVDQRIRRLREKLGDDARSPRRIKSVRGMGYLLAVQR